MAFDKLPAPLAPQLAEPAFDTSRVTFGGWRDGRGWTLRNNKQPVAHDLAILSGEPKHYRAFAADYFELDIPVAAIAHVLAGKRLSNALVKRIYAGRAARRSRANCLRRLTYSSPRGVSKAPMRPCLRQPVASSHVLGSQTINDAYVGGGRNPIAVALEPKYHDQVRDGMLYLAMAYGKQSNDERDAAGMAFDARDRSAHQRRANEFAAERDRVMRDVIRMFPSLVVARAVYGAKQKSCSSGSVTS